jgi:hypothetical protein
MEQTPWTRALAAVVLAATTCFTCYSLGWHQGRSESTTTYDHRLLEMYRLMRESREHETGGPEDAVHARAAE